MLIAIIPIIALILGILMWRPTMKEAGKVLFSAAVLITLYVLAHYTVHIG
jgi:hypothetical protein